MSPISNPFHNPFGAIRFITRDVQCSVELKNNLSVPRMLEFKNLGEAKIIQIVKQLIETTNIAHGMINNFLDPGREHFDAEGILSRILQNAQEHVFHVEDVSLRDCIYSISKNI